MLYCLEFVDSKPHSADALRPPRPASTEADGEDPARPAPHVAPASHIAPRPKKPGLSPSEQRSNSLARLRAAAMDLEKEISHKEIEQERLSKEMTEVRTLLVQQHRALEALKDQLSTEREHASEQLQAAQHASEHLQEEQDAFLALLLDEHEQELARLRRERDEALAQSAMAEHTRRRVSVEQDLAARIDWLRGECDEARRSADEAQRTTEAAEQRADTAEHRLGEAEGALKQARGELDEVRRELAAMKRELTEARLGVAEAKSEAQDARRERDRSHEQRNRAVEEIERLRNLISGTDLRQRPTDPALQAAKVDTAGAVPNVPQGTVASRETPRVAPEVGKRDTSTAPAVPRPEPSSESKIALGRVELKSSSSKLRPAAPVEATPVAADSDGSVRQTKPTTPSMPAMRAQPFLPPAASPVATPVAVPRASHELETMPPPAGASDEPEFEVGYASAEDLLIPLEEEQLEAAALDMTRDLAWEGVDDEPEPNERRSSRPVGPAERPPVMRQKPMLERSPGGYSMPPDASGTIEVLHPLGPNKR
ncbi:MAG: hypothetical protein H6718_05740 [Polyangiaceae bacterium]|nr:hypothetical protein [Myxococcales bacterium]MCB9584877.1 hypothetical protein [Polyangiaceae bacterium]MCB9607550.1 hypothetical protein [Polyangiaceae bacterium]